MNLTPHIQQLLLAHNCVILPNFGALLSKSVSAKIDKRSGTILPPSKQISFNSVISESDGLLVNYLAKIENLSAAEANAVVEDFIYKSIIKLENDNALIWNGIGKFYYNIENSLQFAPNNQNNFLKASYGLPELKSLPLSKRPAALNTLSKTKAIAMDTEEKDNKNRKKFSVLNVAILLLVGLMLLQLVLIKPATRNKMMSELAGVFTPSSKSIKETKTNPKNDVIEITQNSKVEESGDAVVNNTELINEDVKEATTDAAQVETENKEQNNITQKPIVKEENGIEVNNSNNNFYAVVGSFKEMNRANVELKNYQRKGLKPQILNAPNGNFRVAIPIATNKQQGVLELINFRKQFGDAWLLKD